MLVSVKISQFKIWSLEKVSKEWRSTCAGESQIRYWEDCFRQKKGSKGIYSHWCLGLGVLTQSAGKGQLPSSQCFLDQECFPFPHQLMTRKEWVLEWWLEILYSILTMLIKDKRNWDMCKMAGPRISELDNQAYMRCQGEVKQNIGD